MPESLACPSPLSQRDEQRSEFQSRANLTATLDEFYEQWFHDVCRWARALGGMQADVEDIAQEVFLVVQRKFGDFDHAHPKAWLYRITQRQVGDYRRRAWFRRTFRPQLDFFSSLEDPKDGPHETLVKREAESALSKVLERMSPQRRAAFILYEIEGYSGEEIAELEGIPAKTIHSRLGRARSDFLRFVSELPSSEGRET